MCLTAVQSGLLGEDLSYQQRQKQSRAGLHDNVSADLLPYWQKVRQSRATQPRYTDVPDWVKTTSAMQPAFLGIVTVLMLSAMVASWHPTGATLAEGRSGTSSCNRALDANRVVPAARDTRLAHASTHTIIIIIMNIYAHTSP